MSLTPPTRRARAPRGALIALTAVVALAVGLGPSAAATAPAATAPAATAPAATAPAAGTAGAAGPAATTDAPAAAAARKIRFRTASFNILGSHHTAGPGGFANGNKRARLAAKFLRAERTSVLGMSEAERAQMRIVTRRGGFRSFPTWRRSSDVQTAQSVVWKPQVWKRLRAGRFVIPFNYGNSREQPMVLLRHRASGKRLWVVSVHLQSGSSGAAVREREIGMRRMVNQVKGLAATGTPVLLSGDMNDRKRVFCQVLGRTSLKSASGGSARKRGACRPPAGARIDWIFGSRRLGFSGFRYADNRRINKITDHTVPVATVTY